MEYRNLYDMITYLQYGTNLHIGVIFLKNYGNEMCQLPESHKIHSSSICEYVKTISEHEYTRCFRCRNLAIQKALKTKTAFGGLCINGVYEYTHPVIINDDVACIIFIGNILSDENNNKIQRITYKKEFLLNDMERDFCFEKCKAVADLIEGHICTLLEKYPNKYSKHTPLVQNIQKYIDYNLEFNINSSQIAKFFHYNKRYIGQLFKKETGLTISEFINIQRIKLAKNLLVNTDDSIINISLKVGFNNVTYFNRIFKKISGFTPTQYRQK